MIARTHQTKKYGVPPAAAIIPELLYINKQDSQKKILL
jgi:hypothetical protein